MVWWQIRAGVVLLALASSAAGDDAGKAAETKVSYHNQIVPILRANCHGCHQPAKDKGEYLTTSYDALLKGGESEIAAIVPGNTDESYLLELITPVDGKAEMPQGKKPLAQSEIDLIRRWIEEGAVDDTPAGGRPSFDSDHPPLYTRPPVITSLDFSPDGTMLALAGFHEVLLVAADGSRTIARLVGMSERIESVRFSPDGSRLAVTGGLPCRMGEVQIWDVALRKLALSHAVTFDTVYGGSWSPDGKLVAFGCADKSVRAIEAATGKEVVYMAAHEDWIRGTVFSGDGKAILSVSRDKTVKMTDVATQRFLGNLTTHTPGVLRGGMIAIDRHPKRDEVLAGGADGAPKLFQMDVKAAPASGGNPNQIREYAALRGRVFGVRFSPDGTKCFAAGSLDGAGQVSAYETDSGKPLWTREIPETGIYALAASHDGKKLAAAGGDGQVRLVDPADGAVLAAFMPFEVKKTDSGAVAKFAAVQAETQATPPTPAAGISISGLDVEPKSVRLSRPTDYVQLVLTATAPAGSQADVTRAAAWRVEGSVGQITAAGRFTPSANGAGKAIAELGGQRVEIPVEVTGLDQPYLPDFIRDVNPVLTRLGCNAGTCHGAANGKNGFKLSLRGYDAVFDIRSLTDDLASRRVNT
ncbi:MAG: PQQ-binding-like beta-propeller repeat protein, partial [Pirellulales bacterium]|nr:PQQ-binding-like beta-propeller repeat protein [Pirellulales bacterium]